MRRLLLTTLILLGAVSAHAIDLGYAKEDAGQAGAFFEFAASARSLAMGHAYSGLADDAGAGYWNPAGLTQIDRREILTLYSALEEDTSFGFLSYAHPTVDYGHFGFSVLSLRSQGFEKRNAVQENLGSFDQSDLGLLLSHGFKYRDRLSLGANIKVVRQKIDVYSATGYGLDTGLMWKIRPNLQAGATLRNLLPVRLKLKSKTDTYPWALRTGLSYQPGQRWTLTADLDQTRDRSMKLYLGSEYKVSSGLALRAGLNESELAGGMGFQFGDWSLDYAFGYNHAAAGIDDLGGSHRFGFSYKYGSRVSEQSRVVEWQRKGQLALELMRDRMENSTTTANTNMTPIVDAAEQALRYQAYTRPLDVFLAQGYISFFRGDYARSLQAFGEALALEPENATFAAYIEKARALVTEEQSRQLIATELQNVKDSYLDGRYQDTVQSCDKILALQPDHAEALTYLDDAKKRISEPIERELRIARLHLEKEDYLDAIRRLQIVKKLDPTNAEADHLMSTAIAALESKASAAEEVPTLPTPLVEPGSRVFEISSDPTKSRELYSQGLLLYSQGDLQRAVAVWERAVKLDNANSLAKNAYTRALAELKEQAESSR